MMNLIDCYVLTSRIALRAKCTDPTTWQEMHTLLPSLREYLSCQVCHKLLDRPNPHSNGYACTACVNDQRLEDVSSSIIQCYKKLCAYIQKSPLYGIMCSRDEDNRLVELLSEAIEMPRPINGHNGWVNGTENKQRKEKIIIHKNDELKFSSDIQLPHENKMSNELTNLQMFNLNSLNGKIQNQPILNSVPKKKKIERRWGCRCGNATSTPGKLTCFGQRCPCYTEHKPCDRCKCRGCRNPRPKPSNNDNNGEVEQIRRKPVTLELVSALKPSQIKGKSSHGSYTTHNILQFPSHSRNYEQGGTEVTLGHVNSIFHSP